MPVTDPDRLQALVLRAAELPAAESRALLDAECAGDPAQRARAESLVEHCRHDTGEFDAPILTLELVGGSEPAQAGDRLGPYVVVRLLGQGAMGAVYLAVHSERADRFAIKVLHPSLAHGRTLQRFQREAHLQEKLEHPGIARFHEFQRVETPKGRRYFVVLEYVDGLPLDRHILHHSPDRKTLLDLFVQICDAVAHAHREQIIHRDLKPANVLVDRQGRVRVVDFGIGRALNEEDGLTSISGDHARIGGTIPYMSPEQVSGQRDKAGPPSDVYSLGVIAYELLAGRLPVNTFRLPLTEAMRRIMSVDPPALRTIDPTLDEALETIVAQALDKDPRRRYPTALELAQDVRRFLAGEPITARRTSRFYHLKRFAERNRLLVAGFASAFVLLIAGVVVSTLLAQRAIDAAEQSGRMLDFLEDTLVGAGSLGGERRVSEVLFDAQRLLEPTFESDPELSGAIGTLLARALVANGYLERAEALALAAESKLRSQVGPDDPRTLASIDTLGFLRYHQGRVDEARDLFREAAQGRARVLGRDARATLSSFTWLANAEQELGRLDAAEALHVDVLRRREAVLGERHEDTLTSVANMARIHRLRGRTADAEAFYRRALEMQRALMGESHPEALNTLNNLGTLLAETGRAAQAVPVLEEVLAGLRARFGPAHPDVLVARQNIEAARSNAGLGGDPGAGIEVPPTAEKPALNQSRLAMSALAAHSAYQKGDLEKAERLYREVAEGFERVVGPRHEKVLGLRGNIATVVGMLGRQDEALRELERLLDDLEAAGLLESQAACGVMASLGRCHVEWHDPRDGEPYLLEAARLSGVGPNERSSVAAQVLSGLARLATQDGHDDDAARFFARALALSEKDPALFTPLLVEFGRFHALAGRHAQAEAFLRRAASAFESRADAPPRSARLCYQALADLYESMGRPGEAQGWRECQRR